VTTEPSIDDARSWAPIFVIGSPRSGTSILAQTLSAHSALWTSGESYFIYDLYCDDRASLAYDRALGLSKNSWLREQQVPRAEFLRSLGLGIDALFRGRAAGRRWVDHTPHHALMADTLAEMFPTSQFLHIVRDGREVVHSMIHFAARPGAPADEELPCWAQEFGAACLTWVEYVEAASDFCARFPARAHTVALRSLARHPSTTLSGIFEFLGLPDQPQAAQYLQGHRENSSFGVRGVQHAPWSSWSEPERALFDRVAGSLLRQLNMDTGHLSRA
jgi:hypothetical protein